jgi:8-oxo-dGTP pyrophosphatase MutT (NUDIX family)
MDLITCNAFFGGTKQVTSDRLRFRPAVYGLILHEEKVLLMNTILTGRYSLPGGGIELGEQIEETLRREVQEETGLEIEVGRFAGFKEDFFYYNPSGNAYHSFLFYYFCRPLTFQLAAKEAILDDSVDRPQWVEINALQLEDFHSHGELILEILHSRRM